MGFKNIPIEAELRHNEDGWIKRIECPYPNSIYNDDDQFWFHDPNGHPKNKYYSSTNGFDMEYIRFKKGIYKITSTGVYKKLSSKPVQKVIGFKNIPIGAELKHFDYGWVKRIECPESSKSYGADSDKYFWFLCHSSAGYCDDITKFDMEFFKLENWFYGKTSKGTYERLPEAGTNLGEEINEQTIDIEEEFNAGEYVYAPYKPKHNVTSNNFNQLPNLTKSKETTMNTTTPIKSTRTKVSITEASITDTIKESNLSSAKIAAKITLGKTVNKLLASKLKPHLPPQVMKYAKHPLFDILIANLFNYVIQTKYPENKKAMFIAESLMDASVLTMTEQFNIDEIVSNFIEEIKLPTLS